MSTPSFEWDPTKASRNWRKHRVAFDEAISAFDDALATILPDLDHSVDERREILVGRSGAGRLLLVAFTVRGSRIRIISARKATRREQRAHEENDQGSR